MTEFTWRQFRFVVREMTYEGANAHADRIAALAKTYPSDRQLMTRNHSVALLKLCLEDMPIDVYKGGVKLHDGSHAISEGIVMNLPLRVEDFDDLPDPLVSAINTALGATSDAGFELIRNVENLPPDSANSANSTGDAKLH